jgi:hypothetical protein
MKATTKKPVVKQQNSFEDRPYGARMKLNPFMTLVVIAPHRDTAAGVGKESLNENGLRGHENEALQYVKFLGFAGEEEDGRSGMPLVYRSEDRNGKVKEERYGVGSEFSSVWNNGARGFWHILRNDSDKPIMLLVRVTPKTADLRV